MPARGWSASGGVRTLNVYLVLMYYVYIIKSKIKNWKYIGVTHNLEVRLLMHNSGATKSTRPFRPFTIIYSEPYKSKHDALIRENRLKHNFKVREAIYKSLTTDK